ncbi:DUF7512 family protein [Haloarchaeobius sp. HRN-SO-5]
MIDLGSLPPLAEAGALIGIVLVEAVILYVGYGAAEQILGETLIERIKND